MNSKVNLLQQHSAASVIDTKVTTMSYLAASGQKQVFKQENSASKQKEPVKIAQANVIFHTPS